MNLFGFTLCRTEVVRAQTALIDSLFVRLAAIREENEHMARMVKRVLAKHEAQTLYGSTAPKDRIAAARQAAQNIHNNER